MKTCTRLMEYSDAYNEFWWDIAESFSTKGGQV